MQWRHRVARDNNAAVGAEYVLKSLHTNRPPACKQDMAICSTASSSQEKYSSCKFAGMSSSQIANVDSMIFVHSTEDEGQPKESGLKTTDFFHNIVWLSPRADNDSWQHSKSLVTVARYRDITNEAITSGVLNLSAQAVRVDQKP